MRIIPVISEGSKPCLQVSKFLPENISSRKCEHFPTDYAMDTTRRWDFWWKGRGENPFSGSEGLQIDPEQVYVSSSSLRFPFFLFFLFFLVLSESDWPPADCPSFLARYPSMETGFLSHISRGLAGHLGGNRKSGAPETDQFPDACPSFGQFTILTRDRRCFVHWTRSAW